MEETKKQSLINQLMRLIILPMLVVIILLSVLQIYLYYQSSFSNAQSHVEKRINLILPALSKALYDADNQTLNLIGDTLFQDPYVDYLMISDQFSRLYMRSRNAGASSTLSPLVISKPLNYTNQQGQNLLLGNINIHYNPEVLLDSRLNSSIAIAVLGIIKFLLPLLVLIVFLHRKLQKRIDMLINQIKVSRPDNLQQILHKPGDPKEIQELISAYNQLQENNYRYHSRQREAHAKLVERTNEVAEGRESARILTNMLQNSQKRYRALFHRNVDALLIVESFRLEEEERYRIIDANQAAMKVLDQPLEQLIKQDFEVMFGSPPLEHGSYRLDESSLPLPLQKAGLQIELHFNRVMYDKQGVYYVTLRDVSDKIRAEKLEKEADELMNFRQNQMAIAEMATTIAHEINQPLAAIQNYALSAINFSKSGTVNSEKVHQSLNQLMQQADIASQIVQQARSHLGRNDYPQNPLDLIKTLQESLDLCRLRADKHQVKLILQSDLTEAPVIANEVQIKQVMINMISNAIEVLAEQKPENRQVTTELTLDKSYYVISVADNGPGIQNLERVFTTHYSTKEKGLGMGLAICRSITEMHHGSISARNLEHGGAEFTLRLPTHMVANEQNNSDITTPQLTSE